MKRSELEKLIRESIQEVLAEKDPLYVEYHSQRQNEVPFRLNGTKYEYVNAKYPDGHIDIGVYSFAGDIVYGYEAFKKIMNIK